MANPPPNKAVVLLDDLPAKEDAFGAHKRIAQSIRELITTESGGKAIALVGSWGGGKSTVINLIRDGEESKADGLAVFVFDAWAHEGDPLRRTFLEKFISFLSERDWVASAKWQKKLQELSRSHVETETEITPQLTVAGVVCAISILVGTIGLAMVSAGISATAWNIIGFLLTTLPFAVLLIGWIRAKARKSEDVLRYFINKQREITKTSTVETPEPTSVEFQSWFCELAAEALNGNRRILLVIDNLDRVDPDDALKLWSAMRTFVDLSGIAAPDWIHKLWVLAAFDEKAISRLWGNADNQSFATTFLEKTFQVRFRIPSPILSDWREFLMHQLKLGLPNGSEDDFYKISRIYGILKAHKRPPTPRDMKVFVNQIGAVYRTAPPETIPIPHMALYVAIVDQQPDWDPTKNIPEKQHLDPHLAADYEKHLAALFFNMPSDKAVQVLIGEQVERAILEGKPGILAIHAGKDWLGVVIEQVISQRLPEWSKNEHQMIGRAAFLCTSEQLAISVNQPTLHRLVRELKHVTSWKHLDQMCGAGIAALLIRPNFSGLASPLVSALSNSPIPLESEEGGSDPAKMKQWVAGVAEIVAALQSLDLRESRLDELSVGTTPVDYLIILGEAFESCHKGIWKHFRPTCDSKLLLDFLKNHVNSGTLTVAHEQAIQVMESIAFDWTWETLADVGRRLHTTQLQPGQFGILMRIILRLNEKLPGSTLVDVTHAGWVYHHLNVANSTGKHDEAAAAVLGILFGDTEGAAGNNPTHPHSPQGRNLYRSIVSRPDQHKGLVDEVFKLVIKLSCVPMILEKREEKTLATPLLDSILASAAQVSECLEHFPASTVIENYQTLTSVLDAATFARLIKLSLESDTLEFDLAQTQVTPINAGLFRAAMQLRRTKLLTDQVVKGLKAIGENDWLASLTRPDDLIPLVNDLIKWETVLGLSVPLQDALSAFADKLLDGESPDHIDQQICDSLLRALTDEQRRVLKRGILGKVIGANSSASRVIALFSHAISDCDVLGSKADDLIQEGFKKMLDRGEIDELEWMKRVLSDCPKLMTQCPVEIVQDFSIRLQRYDGSTLDDQCKKVISEIKSLFKG